ncbi:hypothetical protein D9M72_423800 [compost metagenome]
MAPASTVVDATVARIVPARAVSDTCSVPPATTTAALLVTVVVPLPRRTVPFSAALPKTAVAPAPSHRLPPIPSDLPPAAATVLRWPVAKVRLLVRSRLEVAASVPPSSVTVPAPSAPAVPICTVVPVLIVVPPRYALGLPSASVPPPSTVRLPMPEMKPFIANCAGVAPLPSTVIARLPVGRNAPVSAHRLPLAAWMREKPWNASSSMFVPSRRSVLPVPWATTPPLSTEPAWSVSELLLPPSWIARARVAPSPERPPETMPLLTMVRLLPTMPAPPCACAPVWVPPCAPPSPLPPAPP